MGIVSKSAGQSFEAGKKIFVDEFKKQLDIPELNQFFKVIFSELNGVQASFSGDIKAFEEDMIHILSRSLHYGQTIKDFSDRFDPHIAALCIMGGAKQILVDAKLNEQKSVLIKGISSAFDFYMLGTSGNVIHKE
jgi:hypothetical protein